MSADPKILLFRYGELLVKKTRDEITNDELVEMESIRKELDLSSEQIIDHVEKLVKGTY